MRCDYTDILQPERHDETAVDVVVWDLEGSDATYATPHLGLSAAPTGAVYDCVPLCERQHSFEESELHRQPDGHIPGSSDVAVDGASLYQARPRRKGPASDCAGSPTTGSPRSSATESTGLP